MLSHPEQVQIEVIALLTFLFSLFELISNRLQLRDMRADDGEDRERVVTCSVVVVVPLLPSIHPRMASEQQGPTATRLLEPPGFMATHYGMRTPIAVLLSHAVFGAMLGGGSMIRNSATPASSSFPVMVAVSRFMTRASYWRLCIS